jgi:4-aminobutyrate aminotransferase-like enzyme
MSLPLLDTSLVFKISANGLSSVPALLLSHLSVVPRHNILLIVDEVQTGFGRTGEMFASDWLDNGAIKPDILIMAKGIANGFPLSAIATRSEISALQPPGQRVPYPIRSNELLIPHRPFPSQEAWEEHTEATL